MITICINYNLFSLQGWYWTGITSLRLFIDELLIPSWPGPPRILSAPDYKIKIFNSSFVEVNSSHGIASKFNSSYYLASQWLTRYEDQIYRVWIPWVDFFFGREIISRNLNCQKQPNSFHMRLVPILCGLFFCFNKISRCISKQFVFSIFRHFQTKISRPKFCPLNENLFLKNFKITVLNTAGFP